MYTDFEIFTIRVGSDTTVSHGAADTWLGPHANVAGIYDSVRRATASPWSGSATLLDSGSLRIAAQWWQPRGAATLVKFTIDGAGFTSMDIGLAVRHAGRASMKLALTPFRRELELAYPDDRFASSLFQVSGRPGFVVSRHDDKTPPST